MARFIFLTEYGSDQPSAFNVDNIAVVRRDIANGEGSQVIMGVQIHEVKETVHHIMDELAELEVPFTGIPESLVDAHE